MQRLRILDAMVVCVGEQGFAGTTVSGVCARARVSRNTFYEVFDGLEDCFLALIDDGYRRVEVLVSSAFERQEYWLDGLRGALLSLLGFFDEEPLLARVWLVETLAAGSWALERRQRHIQALTDMILEYWPIPEGVQLNPLATPGVMELVVGIVQTRLLLRSEEPLIGLLGPLMGLIAAIYLGAPAASVEMKRGNELTRGVLARHDPGREGRVADRVCVPGLLRDPRAHRARKCMLYLRGDPGASNRQVANAVGIARPAQASRVLARLYGLGLLLKHEGQPGGPNAWSLTPLGLRVTDALGELNPAIRASQHMDM